MGWVGAAAAFKVTRHATKAPHLSHRARDKHIEPILLPQILLNKVANLGEVLGGSDGKVGVNFPDFSEFVKNHEIADGTTRIDQVVDGHAAVAHEHRL